MARLDRLPAAREVAQIGAVIGREFSHALLAATRLLPERSSHEGSTSWLPRDYGSRAAYRRMRPISSTTLSPATWLT